MWRHLWHKRIAKLQNNICYILFNVFLDSFRRIAIIVYNKVKDTQDKHTTTVQCLSNYPVLRLFDVLLDPYSVYGVKVVGGKMTESDKLGAFVTAVDEGSPADVVAGLMPGDEIVEWNEQSLVDCTFEDVLDAISNSQESPGLHLVISRHK